ncbi:SPT3 Dosage dependent suppressor of Ty-induced promoter mutations-like protein [Gryganskiella cystojenkinii]|nr:SPT3 Dosage dependent suppressor of Ty-induced promoter mutations-like protein [Gryganskiella cystojenkinii]
MGSHPHCHSVDEEEYMEDDEYEGDDGSDEDRVEDYILGEDSLDLEVEEIPIGDENMEVDEGAEEDDNSEDQEEVESRRKVAEKEINVDSAQMMLIMDDENEQIQEVVAAVEESDEDADEDGQEQDRGEGDLAAWEEDDTPQEAYVDMWSESSAESLSDEDYLELEDDYVVQQRNRQQSSQSGSISSSSTLQSRLDPSTKYMVYLPSGGLTFQFYGMLRALMLSKSLGRTLILPPITASGPQGSSSRSSQSWSDFFDLDTFMYLTGAKVKELKDLRELSPSRAGSSERLRCHITCGVGSLRPLDYTAKEFLRQWKFDLSLDTSLVEATTSTGFNGLVQSLRVQDENEPSLVCITNAFKVDVPAREDWDLFGRYLYFTPRIQKYFAGLVQALGNGLSSSSPTSATVRSWQELMHAQRKYVNDQGETPARAKAPLYHNELDNLQDSAVTVDKTKLIDFQNREKSSSASDGSHNSDDNNISNNNNGDDISNESTTYNDYYLNHNTYANSKVTPPLGPFIAIHVVRGTEFSEYCQIHYPPQQRRLFQQHQIASSFSSCLPTAQELALKLHSTQVLNPQLRGLPVYVIISSSSTSSSVTTTPSTSSTLYPNSDGNLSSTTIFEDEDDGSNNELFSTQQVQQDQSQDERRGDNMDENYQEEEDEGEEDGLQREMDEFRALGWHVLDHQKMGTRSGLGLFGARMIEQMFMARAQVLIGVRASSEARIGAYRQEDCLQSKASLSPVLTHRLNVKTHVFKKELQEYIPTQIEDRLRIETIIYVELSIIDQSSGTIDNSYDFVRLPKDLFLTQADKLMSNDELATKRVLNVHATLQCPSNGWQEEKEACLRCARRMSTKLDQSESRIMHMLPELHRTEDGDSLISFRSGVANIQFKINCYCGHKKEKEGFVIRFDSQSDTSIASHVTLPLMFYHQNKNRAAAAAGSRTTVTPAKSTFDSAQPDHQQQQSTSAARNIVKSVTSKTKRDPRPHKPGHSPIGQQIPSPPNSLLDSPLEWSLSPDLDEFIDSSDIPFTVPSPPPPDPMLSLFPDLVEDSSSQPQQQQPVALISHMTPNTGSVRGGTLVTIHGTGFAVGEVMYVCFGENMVPVLPQHNHMLECVTPASNKADTVPVFAVNAVESAVALATFTYVDDNERELIKLALQRMMNITARMDGPLDSVMTRAHEFAMFSDLLEGGLDSASSLNGNSFSNVEQMVLQTFRLLDTASNKNVEGLSMVNSTGHSMLHLAVAQEFQELARELMARGVNVLIQDKNSLTALDWARNMGKSQTMIDILTGSESTSYGAVKDTDVVLSESGALFGNKLDFITKSGELAHGLVQSVSPGSGQNHDPSAGISGGHSGINQSDHLNKSVDLALDLSEDPHMDFEWEGFGQGPGMSLSDTDDVAGSKILEEKKMTGVLFDNGASTFAQQDEKSLPQGGAVYSSSGTAAMPTDPAGRMAFIQHQYERRKTAILSAIPTLNKGMMVDEQNPTSISASASGVAVPTQGSHSPAVTLRLPIPGLQSKVPGAGVIMSNLEQEIPIETSDFVDCPIGGDTSSTERLPPLGTLDRTAPIGQEEKVAQQGRTFGGEEWVPPSHLNKKSEGGGSSGSSSSSAGAGASAGIATGIPGMNQRIHSYGRIDEPNFQQVQGLDVQVGHHSMTVEQAAVQSGRNEEVSEPLQHAEEEEEELYLGGLPVTVSPRSARTIDALLNRESRVPFASVVRTEQDQEQQQQQDKDEEENPVVDA